MLTLAAHPSYSTSCLSLHCLVKWKSQMAEDLAVEGLNIKQTEPLFATSLCMSPIK